MVESSAWAHTVMAASVLIACAGAGCGSDKAAPSDGAAGGSGATSGAGGSGGSADASGRAGDSGSDGGNPADAGSGDRTVTLPDGVTAYVNAFCAAVRSCCQKAGLGSPDALATCESQFPQQSEILALVGRGTVTPNSIALAACATALGQTASDCTLPSACQGLWSGTRSGGEACSQAAECAGPGAAVCLLMLDADGGTPAAGVCRPAPRGASGGACLGSCASGMDCSVTSVTPEMNPPLALCYDEDGLFCDLDTQNCAGLRAPGATCDLDDQCGIGGYCNSSSVCATRKGAGQACTFSSECSRRENLICAQSICAKTPFVTDYLCSGDYD